MGQQCGAPRSRLTAQPALSPASKPRVIILSQYWLTLLKLQKDVFISTLLQIVETIWWPVSTTWGPEFDKWKGKKTIVGFLFLSIL